MRHGLTGGTLSRVHGEQCGGLDIKIEVAIVVSPESRRGAIRRGRPLQSAPHGLRLAPVWDDAGDGASGENGRDTERQGVLRDLGEAGEVAFTDLLAATGLVERHHVDRVRGGEIGWRVIEGEVPVFADADAGDVDAAGRQQGGVAATLLLRVGGGAVEQVDGTEREEVEEPLAQVAPEARRVLRREPEILVEVEGGAHRSHEP